MNQYYNICEFFEYNIYSIIVDMLTTFIGAFLGLIVALIIYRKGEKKERTKELSDEKVKAYNQLKRFSLLLKSVVDICKQQNDIFEEFSKKLIEKPYDSHLISIMATNDRERLIKSDDSNLFKSYMILTNESANKFVEYQKIFLNADYIFQLYTVLFNKHEKYLTFLFNDLKDVSDSLLKIINRIVLEQNILYLNGVDNSNPEFQFLEKYKNTFQRLKEQSADGFANFGIFRNEFLVPLQGEIFKSVSNKMFAFEIESEIAIVLTKLNNRKANAESHAATYKSISEDKKLEESLGFLESIKTKIEKINEP